MLLIDGVKYLEWTPKSEEEFEQIVSEHTSEIFGEQSIYLDRKQKLRSLSGIGSIPDGYVITFGDSSHWHIVEVELSSHPLHDHIVSQVGRFISGIENLRTQNNLVNVIYDEIINDDFFKLRLRKSIGLVDIHRFLTDLISKPPMLTIIIEKASPELSEALKILRYPQEIKVVEFQTFERVGVGLEVHAHLFEPVYTYLPAPVVITQPPELTMPPIIDAARQPSAGDELEIVIRSLSFINFHIFRIPKGKRQFFPGFRVPFTLETDIGERQTYVVSAKAGTKVGDPNAGDYFQANLAQWYRQHPTIRVGDKVKITAIEPMKKYRLETLKD